MADRLAAVSFDVTIWNPIPSKLDKLEPSVWHVPNALMAAERIHGNDITVPILAKTSSTTGRLWSYVLDDQPFGGPASPAALFFYLRDRSCAHPARHIAEYSGVFQADAD